MNIHVDTDDEMKCIDQIVHDPGDFRRIVFLHGESGSGKTALLRDLYKRKRAQTAIAWIDIKCEYDVITILDGVAEQFASQGISMARYERMSVRLSAGRPINIDLANVRANKSPIDVTVQAIDDRRDRARLLLAQLLDELEANSGPPRRLILLDGYEKACEELTHWINSSIMARIPFRTGTACVIAGIRHPPMPETSVRDRIILLPLKPLNESHVSEWLAAAGLDGRERDAELIRNGTKGNPGKIAEFIANLSDGRWGQEQ
jgi:type II secretory pathway predicted ATPase ExeA